MPPDPFADFEDAQPGTAVAEASDPFADFDDVSPIGDTLTY